MVYHIYLNARYVLFLNFMLKYEVILNSCMKCQTGQRQTGSIWTRPCEAKPDLHHQIVMCRQNRTEQN